MRRSPRRASASPSCAAAGGNRRRQAADHAADHARALAGPVSAGRDSQRLGQALDNVPRSRPGPGSAARSARSWRPASAVGQLADEQDIGVERSGQRLVEFAGVEPGRARAEPLDDDDVGSLIDRLPGSDDLLEHGVDSALAELLLQLGGGQRIRGAQRSYGRDQRGRAVRAAVGPGLGHRLDEGDVHAAPVEGPHQARGTSWPGPTSAAVGTTSKVRAMTSSLSAGRESVNRQR